MAIVRAIKFGKDLIKKGSTGKPTRTKAGTTTRKDIQSTRHRGSVKKLNSTSNSGTKTNRPTKKITQQTPPRRGRPSRPAAAPKSRKTFTKADALKTGATVAGITAIANRSASKKEAPKAAPVKKTKASKPTRRAGPSGPKMTSMKAPSTGPKPRNKDEKKKPRRPSGPTMTSFKR
jgi:hypothetical protein